MHKTNTLLFTLLFLGLMQPLLAQPINEDCNRPIELDIFEGNWCSDAAAFSNSEATKSTNVLNPGCWPDEMQQADVWFSFIARTTDINILMIGNTAVDQGGDLNRPQFAVYDGECGNFPILIACASDNFSGNTAEIFVSDLTIGKRYLLIAGARNNNQGTFQLCINSFNSVPDPKSDCNRAVLLCDKASFTVENLQGVGARTDEVTGTCINQEFASAWYKWICKESGTLTFTLSPTRASDDLDFAVYELPGGLEDCDNKILLRCMASGENVGEPFANWEPCTGPTGLALNDADTEEIAGCQPGNNNFVRHIDMIEGTAYVLIVNNFSNTGSGFTINWGGTGTFLGPEAEIIILDAQTVECDKEFTIDEIIDFPTGSIASIQYNFGLDATPQRISGEGPHTVVYSSIGDKAIVLQLVSDSGCITNEILQIHVEPCCEDLPDIDIMVDSTADLRCNGIPEGFIEVSGSGGTPFYQYSLDGDFFQFNNFFDQLLAGHYFLYVQDTKGCLDSIEVFLEEPPPLTVDAGPDVTVELGTGTDLNANVSPIGWPVRYNWEPEDLIEFGFGPDIFVFPLGTTTYTVLVTDSAGCIALDSVTVFTDNTRPVFIPNAISPNGDGTNDYFTVYANPAASRIEEMLIFNRWGNKVYEGRKLPINSPLTGWDGTFNGSVLDPGVFVYFIKVAFIDQVVVSYKGDVTLIR